MYKTKKLLKWIDKKVIKYCEYLEIVPPIINYTQKDFAKNIAAFMGYDVDEYTEHLRIQNMFERCWRITQAQAQQSTHIIAIYLNTIIDKAKLEGTIVHELCHLRYREIDHGEKFDSIISKTIKECK